MSLPSRPRVDEIISPLTIEKIVNGGAGLAYYRGQVVFVPHAAVGDSLICQVKKSKKTFLEAEIVQIVTPGVARQATKCPVAGECGGCHWQHISYQEQLRWKESLFYETLSRHCQCDTEQLLPIIAAADEWNYRSRVQIKCRVDGSGFVTGFYQSKTHSVVPIEHCPIVVEELNCQLDELRKIIDHSSYAAAVSQLDLAIGADRHCSAVIHYSGSDLASFGEYLAAQELSATVLLKSPHKSGLIPIQGDGILEISVDSPPIRLRYASGSFAQINLQQNRQLVDTVIRLAQLSGSEHVLDLYCGMGNFSLPLARRAKQVVGVEESTVSIEMAEKNSCQNGIENVTFFSRAAEGALTHFLQQQPVDLLVLDPPRSGAAVVMAELVKTPVKQVIYVSCDPQTLARDLKVLVSGGYELLTSQPIDLFPQTYHCESVTLLKYRDCSLLQQ